MSEFTLNVPVQLNRTKEIPSKLYPGEVCVLFKDSNTPTDIYVGKYVDDDSTPTNAVQLKIAKAGSADSFKNGDTYLSNDAAGKNKSRFGNFDVTNSSISDRQYKWTTIASGNIDDDTVTYPNENTKLVNYNEFKYINIDHLGRIILKRGNATVPGEVFGDTFPSNPKDGQLFFKIATL